MTIRSLVTPLKNSVCYTQCIDVMRVSPDVPCASQKINKFVDILWRSNNKERIFAGFALHGVINIMLNNKLHLIIPKVSVSFIFNLFIKKHSEDILGEYKKEIYIALSTVEDNIINIQTM